MVIVSGQTSLLLKPSIIRSGLRLWLDASDIKSYPGTGNTWFDISGQNNHATLSNCTYNSDFFGNIKTNGIGQGVVADKTSLRFTTGFTLSMWARFNNEVTDSFKTLIGKPAYYNYGIIIEWYGGNPILGDFTQNNNSQRRSISENIFTELGEWNFITHSFRRAFPTIIPNNQILINYSKNYRMENYITIPGASVIVRTSSNNLFIGDSNGLDIDIGEVHLYNRGLTRSEILLNFEATRRRFGV